MRQAESEFPSGAVAALLVATAPDAGVQAADLLWRTVAGRPLITWPLRVLLQLDALRECALVAPAERADDAQRLLATEAPARSCAVVMAPERDWRGALINGLARVSAASDWVIVIDATLPLVSAASLGAGLRAAARTGVAIAGEPVKETLKRVDANRVVETLPRDAMRRLLSPSVFQRAALERMLERLAPSHPAAHDLVTLARLTGAPLTVYEAGYSGVRVTSEADLAIVETLLRQRSPEAH
jgi:2-C-methyl-D-erythritol 4-phosphate cytidylyltransferase